MSLFGKIKTAVMGNPVTREFELGKHIASAGPGLLWKVHAGVKKTSRQEVSIFVFDKKAPEFEKLPKKQKEAIYEMLKKGPNHLIKLRHPRLLTIEHQVEESGDTLAFVSEPIFASLSNLLGHYENMPSPLPLIIKEHQLHPIEIQFGLMQVAEGLSFLHTGVRMMHGNLTPQNIVINSRGNWKIMGFNFCCYSQYQSEAQTSFAFREWDSRSHLYTNPSLDYLAPEYILTKNCGTGSDVFSYGMLTYALYNGGKPLFENNNNMLSFKQNAEQVSRISESALGGVPADFRSFVRSMLAVEPAVRPDALQITKNPFFDEVAISTLKYLDTLYEKKDIDKSQFFKKNLARVMTKLPKRLVHQRVLPPLSDEFRNHKMIPFVLPLVLLVAEDCTLNEYSSLILPVLTPAMKIQDPIQIPLIFLQKMDLLLKLTPQEQVQQHVLPMITKSLEAEHSQLQELCVNILPSFASMVDYSSMKHSIVPRITALCLKSKEASLCIKCLVTLGQMLDILDKHIVLDHILPTLQKIPSREPGVLMAVLGIYHQTLTKQKLGLDKKLLAETVIPYLVPLSIEPSLNLKQFGQFMKVIREMLMKVETQQQAHLDQLSKMEEQTKSTVEFAREVAETKAMDDAINRLEGMFTGTDPREEVMAPRRGDNVSKSGSFGPSTAPTPSSTGENTNFLTGVDLSELSSTFASNSSQPKVSQNVSPTPPLIATPTTAKKAEPLQPTQTGYKPPSLLQMQQQKEQKTDLSGLTGMTNSSAGSSWSSGSAQKQSGSTWSSNISQNAAQQGSGGASATQNGNSIFSGLATNSPLQPTKPASSGGGGMFGGMNVNQTPPSSAARNELSTGLLIPTQISSSTGGGGGGNSASGWSSGIHGSTGQSGIGMGPGSGTGMGSMSGTGGMGSSDLTGLGMGSSGMGSGQYGMGSGGQSGMGVGQGWSRNSMNNQNMSGGMQSQQNQNMNTSTWSGGYGGMGTGTASSNSSTGWSQGLQSTNQNTGMGLSQQTGFNQQTGGMQGAGMGMASQQPQSHPSSGMGMNQQGNIGTGMNWSSNIQSQPSAASSMMMQGGAGMQPLIATPGTTTSQAKPAPGANPFADFLS